LLLWGAAFFAVISLFNAYAPSAHALIGARALLGVAGATVMPATLSLVRELFTDGRQRSVAIGIWASAAATGSAFGPVLGGVLLTQFWWGSVFLINIPVVFLLLVSGAALLPELRIPRPGPWDVLSVVLSMTGMLSSVYALKELAYRGFAADMVVASFVGIVTLAWFVRRQLTQPVPLMDVRLFVNRSFSGVVIANVLSVLGLSGVLFFGSQYFQLVKGYSPVVAGIAEMPASLSSAVFGVVAGVLVGYRSHRVVFTVGLVLAGLGMGAFALITPESDCLPICLALFVIGAGVGLGFTVGSDVIVANSPRESAGAAAAVSETSIELGFAWGIAIFGSIIAAGYRDLAVPDSVPGPVAEAARTSLVGAVNSASTLAASESTQLLGAARGAFTEGLAMASATGASLILVAAAVVWVLLKPVVGIETGRSHTTGSE
jgi:DHA2 family multidrug resistance protein-like MFS transporter